MRDATLITGATGMIGSQIIRALLQKSDHELYLLLHETGTEQPKEHVMNILDQNTDASRVTCLNGDITEQDCGITTPRELHETVTGVIHAAATTRFDLDLEEARSINVDGTENVAALVSKCPNLQRFAFLSTAYVSGKRTGRIFEDDLEHEAGFVNTYEQTKYEAEERLRAQDLPVATYRLSTVLGDSETGEVTHYTAPHKALRMFHLGLTSMLPGDPAYPVDLIPTDIAAEVVTRLYLQGANRTYHVVAGEEKSYTLREVIDKSFTYLDKHDPEWNASEHTKPSITSQDTFDSFLQSVEKTGNPLVLNVLQALRHFAHQLSYPKTFDRTHIHEDIPEYDELMPSVDDYYEDVVKHCIETKWGKRG